MTASRNVHPSISKDPIPLDAADLPTVCVLCSHNCGIRVDVEEGRIVNVRPDERNPITEGYICNKAVTVPHYAGHQQRVEFPMKKKPDGSFERISWDQALDEIAAKLVSIRSQHSPRSIALCGVGGQANHLDAPYASSFLRAVGSRRWFNAYAQEKTQHHLVDQWMFDAAPSVFFHPDHEHVRYLIVMGTNPRISNRGHKPTETFKALSNRPGCTVVAVDPRETETTRGAHRHLRVRPGGDVYMLLGMAATIVQNELYDAEFLRTKTEGFTDVRDALARIDVSEMAARAGLAKDEIVEAAEGLARTRPAAIMFDLGVEQTPFSTLLSYLIRLNLALTGNLGKEGTNLFLETVIPPTLSAGRAEEPERALASGIPAIRALGNFSMFSPTLLPEEVLVDHPERIRALIVEASNPILSFSDARAWRDAFAALDLSVVIDPAFTETARLADYVLPAACGYEKWEMAVFPKRHPQIEVQLRPPVVPAPAEALPEAEIYARLVERMGIVDALPADLAALAEPVTPQARALFLGTAMGRLGEAARRGINGESQLIFWGYRALGHHFPSPVLVAVWAQAQQNAIERTDAVLRTLGSDWASRGPLEIGEEIFRRMLEHPEGVEIARTDPHTNLDDHIGYPDKKVRLAPSAMIDELERAASTAPTVDPEYPFVLASGLRTRWTANTIQRDPAWRKGRGPHCELSVSASDAARLGITKGDRVRVETRRGAIEMPAVIDTKLLDGHVWMPNGFGMQYGESGTGGLEVLGANCNEITDAGDRDPFTGCPHHRFVRVRLTRVGAGAVA
jgi:anaerobic selenocysteine-containing dehydrogenase